jgi:hypothetical protein
VQPDRLFLERCEQIDDLVKSSREIDLLDLSAHLRQVLLDGLVHKANLVPRLSLRFRVGEFRLSPDRYTVVLGLEDGLDPETASPGKTSKEVDVDGFVGHVVLFLNGKGHTVGDVIKLAANVAGGVHHTDNPREQQRLIAEYSAAYGIGGLPGAIRQLKPIGRVALKGFAPLIKALNRS